MCIYDINGTRRLALHDLYALRLHARTTNLIGVSVVEDGHAVSFRKNVMLCELLLKSSL